MSAKYFIGADGGGSKTDLILIDSAGKEKSKLTVGGTNPGIFGTAQATRTLILGLRQLIELAAVPQQRVSRVLLCMSGNQPYWQEVARQMSGWGEVVARIDSEPVLFLTATDGPALAIHGGTGSFVAARDANGKAHFGGGLGYSLGDPGSGYDLGLRSFRSAFFQIQGWSEPRRLAAEVKKYSGQTHYEALSQWLYTHSDRNAAIAGFSPHLFSLIEEGDEEAASILEESLAEMTTVVCAVADKVGLTPEKDLPCGLSGPVVSHPISRQLLARLLRKRGRKWEPTPLKARPIEGVRKLLMALKNGSR